MSEIIGPITHGHRIKIIELMKETANKNVAMLYLRVARILDMLPIDDNSEILRTATVAELFAALEVLLSIIIKHRHKAIGDPNYSNYNINNIFFKQWTPFAIIYCYYVKEDEGFGFTPEITAIAKEILCDAIIQTFIENWRSPGYAIGVRVGDVAAAPKFGIPRRNYQCDLYKTVKGTLNYIIKIMLIKLEENNGRFHTLRPYAQFLETYDEAKVWVNTHILSDTISNLLEIHTTNSVMLNNALEYEVKKAIAETYIGFRRRRSWADMFNKFEPAERVIAEDGSAPETPNPYLAERRGDDSKRHLLNRIQEMNSIIGSMSSAPVSSAEKLGILGADLAVDLYNALPSTADVGKNIGKFFKIGPRDDPPVPVSRTVGGISLRKKRDKRSRRTEKKLRKRKNTYYKRYK